MDGLVFGLLEGGDEESCCGSHQAEMNSTFLSGNIQEIKGWSGTKGSACRLPLISQSSAIWSLSNMSCELLTFFLTMFS